MAQLLNSGMLTAELLNNGTLMAELLNSGMAELPQAWRPLRHTCRTPSETEAGSSLTMCCFGMFWLRAFGSEHLSSEMTYTPFYLTEQSLSLKCSATQLTSCQRAAEKQLHGKEQLPLDQGVFHPPSLPRQRDSCLVTCSSQEKAVRYYYYYYVVATSSELARCKT